MLTLQTILNLNSDKLSFLFLTLIRNNSYNVDEIFIEIFKNLTDNDKLLLRIITYVEVLEIIDNDDSLFLKLQFKGNSKCRGGIKDKNLRECCFTSIKKDVLFYLLITLSDEIKQTEQKYLNDLKNSYND